MTLLPRRDYPPADKGLVVLWGLLAYLPFGGMTWQVLHHLVGLRRLGFDVWYVEDSDRYPFALGGAERTTDVGPNVEYLHRHLAAIGLGDRWVFRSPTEPEQTAGALDIKGLDRLYRDADVVLNLCGAQELLPRHDAIDCLVYVETDPVQSQVAIVKEDPRWIQRLDRYQHHFTYGTSLGSDDCPVPMQRYDWVPTVPPVVTDWWVTGRRSMGTSALTTVLQWHSKGHDVEWNGEHWRWRKDVELAAYLDLPAAAPIPLEVAVRVPDRYRREVIERLRCHGWRTRPAAELDDPYSYRCYIRQSVGEFSVAKQQYVAPRSGWFSDRSVCYLAAGRPVVVQDTGFQPTAGRPQRGLRFFSCPEEALESVRAVSADYASESAAAEALAREVFEAERVIDRMMRRIGLL